MIKEPMGWFSRRKDKAPPKEPEDTFKARVEAFWGWYTEVAPRFYETIEQGKCAELASEVSGKINELFPGLSWVFGPGEGGIGHSLTLTPEGVASGYFLTEYWKAWAPDLEGWTFYDARQPGNVGGSIRIGECSFEAEAVWLAPDLDEENEKIDLTVWHPLFDTLDHNQQLTILFLWLDEALGERGTSRWIGAIEISNERLKDSLPLSELREFAESTAEAKGWDTQEQIGVVYELKPSEGPLRADTFVGSTSCYSVIRDYFENFAPHPKDPVAGLGADFVFLSIDGRNFPDENHLDFRAEIEERIEAAFENGKFGLVLGGALGLRNGYIDLLIFDGENSIERIQKALEEKPLPYPVVLHPFYETFPLSREM